MSRHVLAWCVRYTVDWEVFVLQNFCMTNFREENFVGTTLYNISINSAHAFL